MPIIHVENLKRTFKDLTAVDGISFDVEAGEVYGFLGPNGAGKTTTINMLSTLLRPTSGTAVIAGHSIIDERVAVRKSIGLIFQESTLDEELTALENLHFHAEFYGVPKADYQKRTDELLQVVDLADRKKQIVRHFSGGMKRRLEIVRGMLHYPKVLILDEPTIGLDPQTRATIWQYILKVAKQQNITLFLTTHYLNEAEYCDRIAVMDHGKIIALDTPRKLKEGVGGDSISLATEDNAQTEAFLKEKFSQDVRTEDGVVKAIVKDGDRLLPQIIRGLPVAITSVELKQPSLDDVFIKLTGSRIREQEASNADKSRRFLRRRGRMR